MTYVVVVFILELISRFTAFNGGIVKAKRFWIKEKKWLHVNLQISTLFYLLAVQPEQSWGVARVIWFCLLEVFNVQLFFFFKVHRGSVRRTMRLTAVSRLWALKSCLSPALCWQMEIWLFLTYKIKKSNTSTELEETRHQRRFLRNPTPFPELNQNCIRLMKKVRGFHTAVKVLHYWVLLWLWT